MVGVCRTVGRCIALSVLVGLGAGCGDGPGGAPPAPTTPNPVRMATAVTALGITTRPLDGEAYLPGEKIGVQVTFSRPVRATGQPRIAIEIGSEVRWATYRDEESVGAFLQFEYRVAREDQDTDGISIGADALELEGGTIRDSAGENADLDLGAHAIDNDPDYRVDGTPPIRECTDEREQARALSRAVREWNGTPFRVDMIRNFPEFVTDADLWEQLEPIEDLAEQIEAQLGYRVVEVGDIIEVPAGAAPGWNTDFEHYWRNDGDNSLLPRDARQILVFYLDDDSPRPWDRLGGSPMVAHVCCGTISYNKRTMGPWWTGQDPCCQGTNAANGRYGAVLVHELFHILGFRHPNDEGSGVPMEIGPLHRPWSIGSAVFYATWTDIDALRCIFPEEARSTIGRAEAAQAHR